MPDGCVMLRCGSEGCAMAVGKGAAVLVGGARGGGRAWSLMQHPPAPAPPPSFER